MPELSGLLRRFRFHGVPGAPAGAGVPFDRALGVENELRPLLTLLDDAQEQAVAIAVEAERQAGDVRAQAAVARAHLAEASRAQADRERLAAAAARLEKADREVEAILAAAEAERSRIASLVSESVPALTSELMERVLATGRNGP